MAEPARQLTEPTPDVGSDAANDPSVAARQARIPEQNVVRDSIDEITRLMDETHEVRENLVAAGVPFQSVNVLVEMTLHGRLEARDELASSTVAAAREALGESGADRERLVTDLEALVGFEKDIAHARRIARERGMNVQALNALTQLIRHHPGDGGALAMRDLVAYAIACRMPIADAVERAEALTTKPASVLPQIERKPTIDSARDWRKAGIEALVGLGVGVVLLALVV